MGALVRETSGVKPNLFIVGAAKCGTSSLFHYLDQHPQIHGSRVKEPHYFAPDLMPKVGEMSLADYLSLFAGASPESRFLMEASVHYILSDHAIESILEFNSTAKFIFMVRNPLEMAVSFHSQLLRNATEEDVEDFVKAWDLQTERSMGRSLPFNGKCKHFKVQYKDVVSLGSQLQKFTRLVPEDQRMTIVFDDFVKDPQAVCNRVHEFLGLERSMIGDLSIVNQRRFVRWRWLGLALARKPKWLVKLYASLKRRIGFTGLGINQKLSEFNLTEMSNHRTNPKEDMNRIRGELEDEIQLLEKLLNRNFSHW